MAAEGSYASRTRGLVDVVRESAYQVAAHVRARRDLPGQARHFIETMRRQEAPAAAVLGRPVEGLDLLDVGTGALASQAVYFACRGNRVTSIDLEQQAQGLDLGATLDLYRSAGPRRLLKTLGRKVIGFDRAFPREVARQMGLRAAPRLTLHAMDATAMSFPDAAFDVVHSYDVLEHVSDVDAVLGEMARVLRPGGLAFLILMPYTCENGAHDYRQIGGRRGDLPYWAHLRPAHAASVRPGAYVNALGLRDVEALAARRMPGAVLRRPRVPGDELPRALAALRAAGELTDHPDDDELLALRLNIYWRKP